MNSILKYPLLLFLGSLILQSCEKTDALNSSDDSNSNASVYFYKPLNFLDPVYDFSKNPVTKEGFELGKALFNDPLLSRDNTIACSECHNQSYAFTHHGHPLSHGIEGKVGLRNAPPIQNTAWQKEFFWDGGVGDLDLFPIAPIENPVEMDEKLGNVLEKLKKSTRYPNLFKSAFGTDEINTQRFLKALSQFMNSLISDNSKYDKVMRHQGEVFTLDEKAGYDLFNAKCASCHQGALFTDQSYRNNGLPINEQLNDKGRFRITENSTDLYKFKVPSLRNVELTAPYMHDGRFFTLDDVLNHYSRGVVQSETLDPILSKGISLSEEEKRKIILFLKTLTDKEFIRNTKFSN